MARVLVVGAVAWDRALHLSAPPTAGARIEAVVRDGPDPGPPGRLGGGGANAAAALAAVGHEVLLVGRVGTDAEGEAALAALRRRGVRTDGLARSAGATASPLLLIDPSGERTLIAVRAPEAVRAPPADLSTVADFAPELVVLRAAAVAGRSSASGDAVVVAHLPWRGPPWGGRVDAAAWSRADLPGEADPRGRAHAGLGASTVWAVETDGAAGATAHGPSGARVAAQPPAVVRVDATGAGDAFLAGLGDALAAGAEMKAALAHACRWGAALAAVDGSAVARGAPGLAAFAGPLMPDAPGAFPISSRGS